MIRNNVSLTKEAFKLLQTKFPNKEVAPHYLRMEQTLRDNVNKYIFDHRATGADSDTERKLDRNDLFYVSSILFGWIECNENEEATANIHTFAETGSPLEALYNGALAMKTGAKVNFEALSGQFFKYVPETQLDTTKVSQYNVMDAAYAGVEDIYLFGVKSHELSYEFPTLPNLALAPTTSGVVRKLVLQLNGFIIKNGAIDSMPNAM